MAVFKREVSPRVPVDLLAKDREGRTVLLGIVHARGGREEDVERLEGPLQAANAIIPFAMIVDLDRVRLYRWDGIALDGPVFESPTSAILSFYYPDFGSRPIFEHLLRTLVDAWISDLVFHWKGPAPPAGETLRALGLVDTLEGLTIETEVTVGGHPVP